MILSGIRHDKTLSVLIFGLAIGAAAVVGLLGIAGGWRMLVVLVGGVVFLAAMVGSRNPRLVTLWVLVLSLPMALSKQLDEILYQGGGEQAFRIELYDPFLLLLLLYQLADVFQHRVSGVRIPRIAWLWLAIMVLGTVDVIIGPWRTAGAHELVRMFKVMLLLIVLVNELVRPRRMLVCITPLALGAVLQGAISAAQYLKGGLLGLGVLGETTERTIENLAYTSVEGIQVFRPSGLLLHANILGIYLACILPLLMAALLLRKDVLYRAFLMVAIILALVGLMLSQSRAAWVSFALAFGVQITLVLMRRSLLRRAMLPILIAAMAVSGVVLAFSEQILRRLFASKPDATIGREVFLNDFWKLIWDHWAFGVGLNSYVYEIVPYLSFSIEIYKGWVPPVHNIYLLWWGELGILGLLLHLVLWAMVIRVAVRNLRVRDECLYTLNAACLAINVAMLFDGFFSFSLRVSQPQRLFFFVAALIYAIHYLRLREQHDAAAEEVAAVEPYRGATDVSRR